MTTLTFNVKSDSSNTCTHFFGNDPYIEHFWLRFLGPTATSLLRHLSIHALINNPWFDLDLEELSVFIGTGKKSSISSPVVKQLSRLHRFGLINQFSQTTIFMSPWVPSIGKPLLSRLPINEQKRHDEWMTKLNNNPVSTYKNRLNHLISTMSLMGIDNKSMSLAILNSGIHPSIIGEYIKDIDNKRIIA